MNTTQNIRYHLEKFNPEDYHNERLWVKSADLVNENTHLLEIGCATGYMSEYFTKAKNCKVLAVDYNHDQVEIAQKRGLNAISGNIEDAEFLNKIKNYTELNGKFDIILATELIEHLMNAETFLINIKDFLKPEGYIIVSTPNIAHWSVRKNLLLGNFDYEETGILDKTHLKFYTARTFTDLLNKCAYKIEIFDQCYGERMGIIKKLTKKFCAADNFLDKFFKLTSFQFIIKARIAENQNHEK